MNQPNRNPWLLLALFGGLAYPFIVYLSMGIVPLWIFLVFGLALIGLRLYALRQKINLKVCGAGPGAVAVLLILLFARDQQGAVQSYPVIISLSVAAVFGSSLLFPPPIVERIARLSDPALSPRGVIYTRRVTWVWFIFLLMNAAISFASIMWGTLAQWTLWNGFLSYLFMGGLFAGEYVVRRMVRP